MFLSFELFAFVQKVFSQFIGTSSYVSQSLMRLPVKLWDKYFFLHDFTFTLMRKTDLIKTDSFCNIYCQILIHLGLIWLLQQKFSAQLWPHPWNSNIAKLNQAQQQQSFSLTGLSWSYFLITRPTTHPHTRESIIWQIERLN